MANRLTLGLTCGEPAGIGGEVAVKALAEFKTAEVGFSLIGPRKVWLEACEAAGMGLPAGIRIVETISPAQDWSWGNPTKGSGAIAAEAVSRGARLALDGELDALVTAPLTKSGLHRAGCAFPGHTEFLDHLCGGGNAPAMFFWGERLCVILVTTHLPLAEVAGAITTEKVLSTILTGERGLREEFGLGSPRIGVLGLNPHCGERGIMGSEEASIICAVEEASRMGLLVEGPIPGDAGFPRQLAGDFDLLVAMYHDQGLAPFKLMHFHDGVNVTLGLPIVRTSPDHGTAFDIAGRGVAKPTSFLEAIRVAVRIARNRGLRE